MILQLQTTSDKLVLSLTQLHLEHQQLQVPRLHDRHLLSKVQPLEHLRDDEQIVQTSTGAVGKVVEYDSDRSLLYYQQERFSGFGTSATNSGFTAFSGTNLITGQTSGATLTPSSDTETVTLANSNTLTLTTGYANPELQPDSGNIIYLENRKPIQRDSDQTEDIKLIIEF